MTKITPYSYQIDETDPEKKSQPKTEWQGKAVVVLAAVALAGLIYEVALIVYEIALEKLKKQNMIVLELKAKNSFPQLIHKIKNFDKIDPNRVIKRLAMSSEEEKELINYLEENYEITSTQLQEIFLGAHVVLSDGGEAYQKWSTLSKAQVGYSSHASDGTQYRVKGSLIKMLVFSVIEDEEGKYTWFQLENHPVSFGHIFRHMVDYMNYKLDGLNRGPDGCSKHTDRKPLELKKKS